MTRDEALEQLAGDDDEDEEPLSHSEAVALLTAAHRECFGEDPWYGTEILIQASARAVRDGQRFKWVETTEGSRVICWLPPSEDGT